LEEQQRPRRAEQQQQVQDHRRHERSARQPLPGLAAWGFDRRERHLKGKRAGSAYPETCARSS
jgi:hypothetical protein